MREVPEGFITAIKQGNIKVCELYEFTLRNGNVFRYCTHDDDIDWGTPSKRYYSAPIKRTTVNTSMNLEVDSTTLSISGITDELFSIANTNKLDNAALVAKRVLWDEGSASGMEFVFFVGTGNISFNRNELSFPVYSILKSLNILVPRNLFQHPCNYTLFDTGCTLKQEEYGLNSTVSANSPNGYVIIDAAFTVPVGDPTKFSNGEVHIKSGKNEGERRSILNAVNGLITLCFPLPYNAEAWDTYDYYPGCDYTPNTCKIRYGNQENFYGFSYLPDPEESA